MNKEKISSIQTGKSSVFHSGKPLYLELADHIFNQILQGIYGDGDTIPPEQQLSQEFGISRVTVRKALDKLKQDKLISSVQGRGTMVTYRQDGFPSNMDIIAMVAPSNEPFFSSFYAYFDRFAAAHDSLVVFKQDYENTMAVSGALTAKLIKRNIRNIVIWSRSGSIDRDLLRRLRGLGTNIVFFDHNFPTRYADNIGLDNTHAIDTLLDRLQAGQLRDIHFLGWANLDVSSAQERETAYKKRLNTESEVHKIFWDHSHEAQIRSILALLDRQQKLPQAIVCADGEIGLATAHVVKEKAYDIKVASVDELPDMQELGVIAYRQPLQEMAERTYELLLAQNDRGKQWQPQHIAMQGTVVDFSETTSPSPEAV